MSSDYHDNELPEYPVYDLRKSKCIPSHDIPQSGLCDNDDNSRHSGYRPIPERSMSTSQPFMERGDHWNAPYDDFQVAPSPMPMPPLDQRKLTPHLRESSSKEACRWEGMIAMGGKSVCRAHCFPVGKPPDMVLPEILDCRARTSLDMLAKNYDQAVIAWVVSFAPANDSDVSDYNEFMSRLGKKQRAAVMRLDERNALFLVPPSDFSEKVLEVPGKLSITGVLLRMVPPGSSGEYKPSGGNPNQTGCQYRMPQNYGLPSDQMSSDFPPSQISKLKQLLQQALAPNLDASQRDAQYNPLLPISDQDFRTDPLKRYEATLHLAIALRPLIQQRKGTWWFNNGEWSRIDAKEKK